MNVSDFITEGEFNLMIEKCKSREPFEIEKVVKCKNNQYLLNMRGFVNGNFDDEFWFVSDVDYSYAEDGQPHRGGGTLTLDDCYEWADFEDRLRARIRKYPDYTEVEQLSLF